MRNTVLVLAFTALSTPIFAQSGREAPPYGRTLELDGPRVGLTMLSDGVRAKLQERDIVVGPAISQFGWQFERQFYSKQGGVTALNEWVALLGGLDQGIVIPSVSWLVGVRTPEGAEFGIGPNVTPAGVALAISAGVTFRAGILNVPMNFAVVPTKAGTRVSMLTGFTMRR
jgi:hypothetical protein